MTHFQIQCPGCGKEAKCPESLRGKRVRCKKCGEVMLGEEKAAPLATQSVVQAKAEKIGVPVVDLVRSPGLEIQAEPRQSVPLSLAVVGFLMVAVVSAIFAYTLAKRGSLATATRVTPRQKPVAPPDKTKLVVSPDIFLERFRDSEKWKVKYLGKTVKVRAYFGSMSGKRLFFTLKPQVAEVVSPRDLRQRAQEAALTTYTVQLDWHGEEENRPRLTLNEPVIIEMVLKDTADPMSLAGDCVRIERDNQ